MNIAFAVARGLVGLTGALQLVLGVVFWTGHARGLVPLHMAIGVLFVLALWTLALLSARIGAPRPLVATVLVWGLLLPGLGATQSRLLPGSTHWVIQVTHLLMSLAAMGMAGALIVRARRRLADRSAPTQRPRAASSLTA